jgi:undecaprenyl-diphosphatase
MNLFHAIALGVIQGLTEFIPVSSSAHLIIVPWLLGWPEPGLAFDVALHMGTLLALVLYFWKDLLDLIAAALRGLVARKPLAEPHSRLAWAIAIGTIPAVIAGALFDDPLEAFFHTRVDTGTPADARLPIVLIAVLLAGLGVLLWLAERRARHVRDLGQLSLRDGVLIGLAQALALLPGVSRSGSTLTAGLWLGFKREDAARFSFLLAIPVTLGAGVKKLYDVAKVGQLTREPLLFTAGVVAAAVVGYAAIHFLLRWLRRDSTDLFTYYRWALAAVLVVAAFAR